jgi:hypothetical protein
MTTEVLCAVLATQLRQASIEACGLTQPTWPPTVVLPGVSIGRDDSGAARSVPRTNLILIVERRQTRSATTQGSPFDADLRLI